MPNIIAFVGPGDAIMEGPYLDEEDRVCVDFDLRDVYLMVRIPDAGRMAASLLDPKRKGKKCQVVPSWTVKKVHDNHVVIHGPGFNLGMNLRTAYDLGSMLYRLEAEL